MSFSNYCWVDLPKSRKRCWFARIPPLEELHNYIAIMDDFSVNLQQTGRTFKHLMMWELVHTTTRGSTSLIDAPADTACHITALASANMTTGRFHAFSNHIYLQGDIPHAKYCCFSSTYTEIRRGTREKKVVDYSVPLSLVSLSHAIS